MQLLRKNLNTYIPIICLSFCSALGNIGVVYLINKIITDYFSGTSLNSYRYILFFLFSFVLFILSRWLVSIKIIYFTQKLLRTSRIKILNLVLQAKYKTLITHKDRIFTILTRDTDIIVSSSISTVDIITNFFLITSCFVYIGILSWQLLCCILCLTTITIIIHYYSQQKASGLFSAALLYNDKVIKYQNEILSGFKEISIERKKGHDLVNKQLITAIDFSSGLYKKALVHLLNNRIIGQISFYVFVGLLMTVLGALFHVEKNVIVNVAFITLYIWGPIESVVVLIPNLAQGRASIKRLNDLEEKLKGSEKVLEDTSNKIVFIQASLEDVFYEHKPGETHSDERPFSVGPINFSFKQGDVIFLSGGNGSGKTTFINVLMGLYEDFKGAIYINGDKVEDTQTMTYKSLFAPLFSDFHLFDECYGIPNIDDKEMDSYLNLFEISNKVNFKEGVFSTVDLSTGQRKRLGLIMAIMEKKPILILDEFAADQDPYFKKKFYTMIVPYLKEKGYTLVMITHDEMYYSCADFLYKIEDGKLKEAILN